jgi:hypothetical protein
MPDGHTSDWVRVGRTEIFRGRSPVGGAPLEYATPITLSHVPGRARTLHLCVYSVPKRAGMPHILVAFAEVQLEDIVDADGARLTAPIQVPTPMPDANGKVHEVKVKPTAALFVSAEPTRTLARPARYTLGLTSNFIERSTSLGRTCCVNRAFYTIHIALGDAPGAVCDEAAGTPRVSNGQSIEPRADAVLSSDDAGVSDAQDNPAVATLHQADVAKQSKRSKVIPRSTRNRSRRRGRGESPEEVSAQDVDKWALVFRSNCVTRVNRKASGGTMDINYFSTKPLRSIPGITIQDPDDKEPPQTSLDSLGVKLGVKPDKSQLFSLPNGEFLSTSKDQRVKLSVYDEKKHRLLAHMVFSLRELCDMELGATKPLFGYAKRERRVVGTACLTQVEHDMDPRFFGFRVSLPWLV